MKKYNLFVLCTVLTLSVPCLADKKFLTRWRINVLYEKNFSETVKAEETEDFILARKAKVSISSIKNMTKKDRQILKAKSGDLAYDELEIAVGKVKGPKFEAFDQESNTYLPNSFETRLQLFKTDYDCIVKNVEDHDFPRIECKDKISSNALSFSTKYCVAPELNGNKEVILSRTAVDGIVLEKTEGKFTYSYHIILVCDSKKPFKSK